MQSTIISSSVQSYLVTPLCGLLLINVLGKYSSLMEFSSISAIFNLLCSLISLYFQQLP